MYPQSYLRVIAGLSRHLRHHLTSSEVGARLYAARVDAGNTPAVSAADIRAEIAELTRLRAPGQVGPEVRWWVHHVTLMQMVGPREEDGGRVPRFLSPKDMVFVEGHSKATADRTFVPEGMTVHLYAREGENLLMPLGLVALLTQGESGPLDEYTSKRTIPNYSLYEIGDVDIKSALTAAAGGSGHYMHVGKGGLSDSIRLCNALGKCQGEHTCGGILDICKNFEHVHLLICRGVRGINITHHLGAEVQQGKGNQLDSVVWDEFLDFGELSEEQQEERFLSWDPVWRGIMLRIYPMKEWKAAYDARMLHRDSSKGSQ